MQRVTASLALILLLLTMPTGHAYSVLTHEAIIDKEWNRGIKPLRARPRR